MKKLSSILAMILSASSAAVAKEITAAPAVAVEPAVVIAEEKVKASASRDFKFVNFNLMHGNGMTALGPKANDTYLEVEIGGRKGAFDFYGYIDFSDVVHNEEFSDFNEESSRAGNSNFFAELMPRLSMNEMFNRDLSFGPVKEVYLAGYVKAGESDLWINGLGLGTDIEVPWLGTMGLNAYALYVAEDFNSEREKHWDGYLIKNNWFKPFYFFNNGTFLSYQGYIAYQFDAGYENKDMRTSDEFQWFNGLYWHSDNYALGYGLKYTKNMINGRDGGTNFGGQEINSTGFSHFFAATYKF